MNEKVNEINDMHGSVWFGELYLLTDSIRNIFLKVCNKFFQIQLGVGENVRLKLAGKSEIL